MIIFAVVKFTEGAWVVLVLFAILVPALIRLNTEYRAEAEVLETVTGEQPPPPPHYSRRVVFVFVDSFDLATLAALRYARSLRPTQIRAVHFVIDSLRAEKLREKWTRADRGVALDFIDCPDRRLIKAATDLAEREVEDPGTHVTVILPRRSYSPLLGRLLHDRTADKIAAAVSRIPRSAATIVPYDVPSRVAVLQSRQAAAKAAKAGKAATPVKAPPAGGIGQIADGQAATAAELARQADVVSRARPARRYSRAGSQGQRGAVQGHHPDRVGHHAAQGHGGGQGPRHRDPPGGAELGARGGDQRPDGQPHRDVLRPVAHPRPDLRRPRQVQGSAGIRDGQPVMINPAYELVSAVEEE